MTDAELAILSLLFEAPSYDDELYMTIEKRGLRRWTAIGSSSMYYIIEKLETQGLIERISEEKGRRQHQISQAGIGVLQTSVVDLVGTSHAHDRNFELGLANLRVLKSSQVRSALQNRRQDIAIKLARISEEREAVRGNFAINALFDHHIRMLEAELVWLDEFVINWEAQAQPDPEVVIEPSIAPRIKQVILPQDPDSVHKRTTLEASPKKRATPPNNPTSAHKTKPDQK
ncbi:MAG TPA: PadR family transcriptional regulator [Aggregatilineales bacterium]|nr:PadR family transcriptional regulator [Aggregatilineales bacterium]